MLRSSGSRRRRRGYWLVGSDGGVFAFGDAPYLGSALALKESFVGLST
jgi:hypothetical protein